MTPTFLRAVRQARKNYKDGCSDAEHILNVDHLTDL